MNVECALMRGHGIMGGREVCLNCPYPKCVLDFDCQRDRRRFLISIKHHERREKRNALMLTMSSQGISQEDISKQFGLSRRQVRRVVYGK